MKRYVPLIDVFPGKIGLIRDLRRRDPLFDEVCRDYELLIDICQVAEADRRDPESKADILESLQALEDEIVRALEAAEKVSAP